MTEKKNNSAAAISIREPGVYDIPDEAYHADPCPEPSLSSSVAKVLIEQSARHAWMEHPRLNSGYEPTRRKDFDLGSAAHAMLFGGEDKLVEIEADSYRTKDAREARDAAYEAGKTPVLTAQMTDVRAMVQAARAQLHRHEEAGLFEGGAHEVTLVWREGSIWCRCKLDWVPSSGNTFADFKSTTNANPEQWARVAFETGCDVQAAFYSRGIKAVLGIAAPRFLFVVQEVKPPYALSVCALDPFAEEMAMEKVERAMAYWAWCRERNAWPGYPARTAFIEAPVWQAKKHEDRKMREKLSADFGEDLREKLIDWQAPTGEAA